MSDHALHMDFLDEIIEERTRSTPDFPAMVEEAFQLRVLLRELGDARRAAGLPRTAVAARMRTSESSVARLEAAITDPKFSTIERFAAAVGKRIRWEIVDS